MRTAATRLPRLPPQPPGVAWPTATWEVAPATTDVDADRIGRLADVAMAEGAAPLGRTRALLVVHRGRIALERYAGTLEDGQEVGPATTLPSWSVAKSILHAVVGLLVGDGRLHPDDRLVDVAPGAVPTWAADPTDPRRAITVDHLLHFRAGLAWSEVYPATGADAGEPSDVVEMLYGAGRPDTAACAAARPLVHEPGSRAAYGYSSGTSNLLSAVVRELTGPGDAQLAFLRDRLLTPLGMSSAVPKVDDAGTWIASTYCFATARDLARFGLLYLRDGTWEGRRLLPEGWVDHGRSPQPGVVDDGWAHGAHWWSWPERHGPFLADGYQGQRVVVDPTRDVVVVRLGVSTPDQRDAVTDHLTAVLDCFPELATPTPTAAEPDRG